MGVHFTGVHFMGVHHRMQPFYLVVRMYLRLFGGRRPDVTPTYCPR